MGRKVEVVVLHHRFLRLMRHPFHSPAPFQRSCRRKRLWPKIHRCNNSLPLIESSYHCMVILSTKMMAATSMAESIPTFPFSTKSGGCNVQVISTHLFLWDLPNGKFGNDFLDILNGLFKDVLACKHNMEMPLLFIVYTTQAARRDRIPKN